MSAKMVWIVEDYGNSANSFKTPIWTRTFDIDQKVKADDAYISRPIYNNVVLRKAIQVEYAEAV